MTWDLAAAFLVTWVLSTLLIDAYRRRRPRRALGDRLRPYQTSTLADEAGEWLSREAE